MKKKCCLFLMILFITGTFSSLYCEDLDPTTLDFIPTWAKGNDTHVRIRQSAELGAQILGEFNPGDPLRVLERSSEKMKIGDMEDYWYHVQLIQPREIVPAMIQSDKHAPRILVEGWAYGYFIEFLDSLPDRHLVAAASGNSRYSVEELLAGGADLKGYLKVRSFAGDVMGKWLEDEGAYYMTSPLTAAVRNGNEKIVKLLLDNGSDPNRGDRNGEELLILAFKEKKTAIADMLISYGAMIPNYQLFPAIKSNNFDLVRTFIEHGVDVNSKKSVYGADEMDDAIGELSALAYTLIKTQNFEMADYLILKGADVQIAKNDINWYFDYPQVNLDIMGAITPDYWWPPRRSPRNSSLYEFNDVTPEKWESIVQFFSTR